MSRRGSSSVLSEDESMWSPSGVPPDEPMLSPSGVPPRRRAHVARGARALCDKVDEVVKIHKKNNQRVPMGALYDSSDADAKTPQAALRDMMPMIISAGQQSAGKSTLMNALLRVIGGWDGNCLPTDAAITTLFPTELFLAVPPAGREPKYELKAVRPDQADARPQQVTKNTIQQEVTRTLHEMNSQIRAQPVRRDPRQPPEAHYLKWVDQYSLQVFLPLRNEEHPEFHMVDMPGIPSGTPGANNLVAEVYKQKIPNSQVVLFVGDANSDPNKDYSWSVVRETIQSCEDKRKPTLVIVLNRADKLSPESGRDLYPHLKLWNDVIGQLKQPPRQPDTKPATKPVHVECTLTMAIAASAMEEMQVLRSKRGLIDYVKTFGWHTGLNDLQRRLLRLYGKLFPAGSDLRARVEAVQSALDAELDVIGRSHDDAENGRARTLYRLRTNAEVVVHGEAPDGTDLPDILPVKKTFEEVSEQIQDKKASWIPEWTMDFDFEGKQCPHPGPQGSNGNLILTHEDFKRFAKHAASNASGKVVIKGLHNTGGVVVKGFQVLSSFVTGQLEAPRLLLQELVPALKTSLLSGYYEVSSDQVHELLVKVEEAASATINTLHSEYKKSISIALHADPVETDDPFLWIVGRFADEAKKVVPGGVKEGRGQGSKGADQSTDPAERIESALKRAAKDRDWQGVEAPKEMLNQIWNGQYVRSFRQRLGALTNECLFKIQNLARDVVNSAQASDIKDEPVWLKKKREKLLEAHRLAKDTLLAVRHDVG